MQAIRKYVQDGVFIRATIYRVVTTGSNVEFVHGPLLIPLIVQNGKASHIWNDPV